MYCTSEGEKKIMKSCLLRKIESINWVKDHFNLGLLPHVPSYHPSLLVLDDAHDRGHLQLSSLSNLRRVTELND